MSPARRRLAAMAAAAGYGPDALLAIADAALPALLPGERLTDPQLEHVADAVEVLAQCGRAEADLPELILRYRLSYRGTWRQPFWRQQLRTAAQRFNDPHRYGLSPCEDDPARLARAA